MHQPLTLKINEIFPSIQGEGLRLGEPTLFIRLSECNLKCDFCDTKYAWKTGQEMTVESILKKIQKIHTAFPTEWVCLTGGEPLFQNIGRLVERLKAENFKIQVETNATIFRQLSVDWYTISPKPPDYFYQPEYVKKAKEVKIVVTKGLDLGILEKLRQDFPEKIPLLLQPRSNSKSSGKHALELIKQALSKGMNNVRLTAQIHKFFGWR
ncbi:MAG: 7-carboxy-7-deazaguanine synthase QueE [Candidatus Aminicenantes bacterium]|nr:MAG: 7-carboxy-7-deazaguanine synthase QueE [Candidatus Aminicenantes bacterium]